jgi:DNA-binding SARP family transcriptional activator
VWPFLAGAGLGKISSMPAPVPPAKTTELRLFGPPALLHGTQLHAWRPELPMRLLGLLAASGKPWSRERLATLFWPDAEAEAARRNLRKTLFRLRQWLQLHGLQGVADGPLLHWPGPSDLARMQAACAAGDTVAAIALVGGPLLQGLDGGSPAFQAWLDAERAHWAGHWRALVLQQAAAGLPAAQLLPWTARLLDEDPLDEAAARAHALALARDGQPQQARRVHALWRQQMREELGLQTPEAFWAPPAPAPLAAPAAPHPAPPPRAPAWPEYLTPLVGRQAELQQLQHWAQGPAGLLALVGPPGCGKTRLATAFIASVAVGPGLDAATPGAPPRRLAFVDIDRLPAAPEVGYADAEPDTAVAAADALTPCIAQALGLALAEGAQQQGHLRAALQAEPTLLVLDSFEHRLGDLPLLARLRGVPGLHVLVTSRVRLPPELAQELRLDGLPTAPQTSAQTSAQTVEQTVEQAPAADSEALQLFSQRCPGLGPAARADADRLCRLLQGQPLAIELAARTSRSLAPAELLQTLQGDLAQLAAHAPDLPLRQRSLRASFEAHWLQLPAGLRRVAARLAVLRADFSLYTARAVAAASDGDLAALCDHHALRPSAGGQRLHWHPFLREISEARLAADPGLQADHQAGRRALCQHFAGQLRRLGVDETRPTRATLRYLAEEADNLAAAFLQALALQDVPAQRTLAEALTLHHEFQARCLQGAALLQPCSDPYVTLLRARLLHWAAPAQAEAVASPAQAQLQAAGDEAGLVAAARVQALIAWRRGALAQAEALCQAALARLAPAALAHRAILLDVLGLVRQSQGNSAAAQAAFTEALALNDAIGNEVQAVQNLINLALEARAFDAQRACALAARALALCQEIGFRHYEPHAQVALSLALTAAGQPAAGRDAVEAALALTRSSGDLYAECWAGLALAQARAAAGDAAGAHQACATALAQALRLGDASLMGQHLAQAGLPARPGQPLGERVHEALGLLGGAGG